MSLRTLPGSAGFPLVGETLHFLRDIKHFIDHRIAKYGPVFRTNILGCTTAFSCAYASTLDVLLPKSQHPSQPPPLDAADAYNEFMAPLYPLPNLLLSHDTHPLRTKSTVLLHHLLTDNLPLYIPIIRHTVKSQIHQLALSHPTSLRLYSFFKSLTERIVTTVILGQLEQTDYLNIRNLCSRHFNGIVAAPVHVEAFGARSARASAVYAHKELTHILESRLRDALNCPSATHSVLDILARGIPNGKQVDDHISESAQLVLVLLSTAVPKALASALSSAVRLLSHESHAYLQQVLLQEAENGTTKSLDGVLMETLRLLPPLPGGMRQSNGASVGGRAVPKRCRVWYSALHSNRDSDVYEQADEFLPDRWTDVGNASIGCPFAKPGLPARIPTPLTFGAGERHCKGRDLAWTIMRESLIQLLQSFAITTQTKCESELRFIPVLRPVDDETVLVRHR